MYDPKLNEKWIVDLSPTRGDELGGIRKCLVEQKISENLYRIIPYCYSFSFEGVEEEPMYDHARTVDISRFKQRSV